MGRKLIICCDGTGNEIKENQSNVLKLYRLLKKDGADSEQIAFYDTGVGTISNSGAWSRFKSKASGIFGLATGYGLDDNILDAYRFLCLNYQGGDEIYLFGFSRGAYTVRVLAGLIHMVGILRPENINLCSYALTCYKQANDKDDFAIAWRVNEVLDSRRATIRFMGCWDTVDSVIIPRPDRAYIPAIEDLPFTRENPSVQTFCHAISLDERRRMFRLFPWEEGQKFKVNPFQKDEDAVPQECEQMWFSGVHSDIGGGYPEAESGAAKIPLAWMVNHARDAGLVFRERMVKRLVLGENPANSTRYYAAPDPHADLHDSMTQGWRVFEWLPKSVKYREWPWRESKFGYYLPKCEPRFVPDKAKVHPSVYERRYYSGNNHYYPDNLPPRHLSAQPDENDQQ